MTTRPLSGTSSENRFAVAAEMVALTAAAIGLGLGLLAAVGGEVSHGQGEIGTRAPL